MEKLLYKFTFLYRSFGRWWFMGVDDDAFLFGSDKTVNILPTEIIPTCLYITTASTRNSTRMIVRHSQAKCKFFYALQTNAMTAQLQIGVFSFPIDTCDILWCWILQTTLKCSQMQMQRWWVSRFMRIHRINSTFVSKDGIDVISLVGINMGNSERHGVTDIAQLFDFGYFINRKSGWHFKKQTPIPSLVFKYTNDEDSLATWIKAQLSIQGKVLKL